MTEGKEFLGNYDIFYPEGGPRRVFRPLWWRTWRYLELAIETSEQALTLEDIRGTFCAYPFVKRARFDAGDPYYEQLLEVGWRTARLCAHETYMDCPYYEQLQYAGDTRIQCLISYYMSGDGRLARNAIRLLDESRTAEGATMSRAPAGQQQYIPGFSLWWIGMLHDYWRYQRDPEFVRSMLPGLRSVLGFFAQRQQANGSLGPMPWWNFVDWANHWKRGVPPSDPSGSSAPQDLLLLLAFDWAAELEQGFGFEARASEYREAAQKLRNTARKLYWNKEGLLFSDTPERRSYSQQTNVLAVLSGLVTGTEAQALMKKVLADHSLEQCSFFFRHYLNEALLRTGLGDEYLEQLGPWRRMLDSGLTTWAERPEQSTNASRSDCHAWSASPNVELFRTVLGFEPQGPGMERLRIRPYLGRLQRLTGAIPLPQGGEVEVSFERQGKGLQAEVTLPAGIRATLEWAGGIRELHSGHQSLFLP